MATIETVLEGVAGLIAIVGGAVLIIAIFLLSVIGIPYLIYKSIAYERSDESGGTASPEMYDRTRGAQAWQEANKPRPQ